MADYASNTVYFKMFNEDYRKGGLIHYLDNSQLRMYVILQAYANSHGNIVKENGNSYSLNELSDMVGMNFRTTKRALMDLTNDGYLIIDKKNVINIRTFVFDQVKRKDNNRTGKARFNKTLADLDNKLDITNSRLNALNSKIPLEDGDLKETVK
jgi:DNA-binding transcriptional regulator YhcF (GntR family)